ncbi:hypothetical protein CRG98_024868 [Punica granatum]|uniref:Uncharacterized protein n=1 Tax=Punica granatum TaxID=22663 RepID=A0A2I0JGN2_PUNGR|nr:hypothetical protein CRG98_024868 [Punica granatum]
MSTRIPSPSKSEEETARLPSRVEISDCLCGFLADRVDPRLFSETNHHIHLRGSVRSQEPLTLPQNSIGRHRGDVRPEWCQTGPKFQTCSVFRDLCRDIRVDPITLGSNYHHINLRGSVRSLEPLTLPQNSIGSLRGDVRPDWCQTCPKFQTCSLFRDLCRVVRVDPIILGPNDHHSHLRGSVRSHETLTLPQNSIGSLHGDVRPDLSQSSQFSFPAGSVKAIRVCARPKQPKPDPTKAKSSRVTLHERWPNALLLLSGKERSSWLDPSSIPEFPRVFLRA